MRFSMNSHNLFLDDLIERFELWWETDAHRKNMNRYNKTITKEYLSSLSDEEFINFFYDFVSVGGYVQSGGERTKNRFKDNLENNLKSFRNFVLLPFEEDFAVKEWFNQIKNHSYFGVGIATIFLNRIDKNKFPIMNDKTFNALKKLGYPISSTKSWETYMAVFYIQKELMKAYKNLKNFYKVDSLNHFVIAVDDGREFVAEYQNLSRRISDEIELEELSFINKEDLGKNALLEQILKNSKTNAEFVEVSGVRYKRYNYVMNLIKAYRGFKCQFCDITIPKKDGGYYIETCHIKSKSKKGYDSLENILTLCPNCHKLFDLNERLEEKLSKDLYQVTINKKKYSVKLT